MYSVKNKKKIKKVGELLLGPAELHNVDTVALTAVSNMSLSSLTKQSLLVNI